MKAVIMAGGKGTRLSSVITNIPKPMVELSGKPLLEYQIENLRKNGIRDIIIVVGHLGEVIQEYFRDGERFGVHIMYYSETTPLGTAGALYYLKKELKEDFILLFGDLFININFRRFYDCHIQRQAAATLYAHPNSHPYDSDIIVTGKTGNVIEWSHKNTVRSRDYKNLVNAGVYVLSPQVLEMVPRGQKTDLEKQVITELIPNGRVYAYQCTEYVKDIGTPERLHRVERDYLNGVCQKRNMENKQKCIFLDRDGTINKHIGFLNNREQMQLEEGASKAINEINESEYLAVVISNQPVIARGECSIDELEAIHNRMHTLLGARGAYLDGLFYCPHHPHGGYEGEVKELKIECRCRKPQIGLLERAASEYNIDLVDSWFVGDTTMDIQTGINAGMKTALVRTGLGGSDGQFDVKPDMIEDNLFQCVFKILHGGQG